MSQLVSAKAVTGVQLVGCLLGKKHVLVWKLYLLFDSDVQKHKMRKEQRRILSTQNELTAAALLLLQTIRIKF